jgi:uncharacterized phage protein gp47/JayE
MALENNWVTYLQRSYKTIKASILTRMQTLTPEITDYSESNILVIIASSFAGLVEQLNYYIDSMAREMYIGTARRYSSLVKITRLIDYRVRAKIPATVDLLVTALDGVSAPKNVTSAVTINKGSIVKTSANVQFVTTRKLTIPIGNSSVSIPARQVVQVTSSNIGTTTASANQAFKLSADYTHDSLQIVINSITWELRQTFAFSGPQDKHFTVEVNEAKESWVVFGDGTNGAIPTTGQSVLATYYDTQGSAGRVIANTITTWLSGTPSGGGATSFSVTNPFDATGGLDVEDLEGIRKHAPLSLRTLDRAVTLQDHTDIALLVPGVGKANTFFDSSIKAISFYIAPEEGGIASSQLCQDVVDYFATRKMISTSIAAYACGETYLRISLTAMTKPRRSSVDTKTDIENALLTAFGFNKSDVNKSVRKSDIIALVDNLDKVDYLTLNYLTTKPYPRVTIGTNQISSTWYALVTNLSTVKARWRLFIVDASTRSARLYKIDPATGAESFDQAYTYTLTDPGACNLTSTDGSLQIAIYGTFTTGNEWQFTTYPYNEELVIDDNTIPVTRIADLDITVNSPA